MKVAYQGEPGAFSHEACLTFLPSYEVVRKRSFADVFAAVLAGETELGVVPEENVAAGIVPEVRDLLARGELSVIARHLLPIRMHLLGVPGATLPGIQAIISHPIALAQCARTLGTLGIPTIEAFNTAGAAKDLAATGDRTQAVLASEVAAKTYGLEILRRDMQDRSDNATSFVVLGRIDRETGAAT